LSSWDNNKGIIGVHEMALSDECLTEKTEFNDSKIRWNSIFRIESTAEHTFIYTGDITAYVIPQKSIKVGNYDQFVEKLNLIFSKQGNFQPERST
jgi:hypothetical protein